MQPWYSTVVSNGDFSNVSKRVKERHAPTARSEKLWFILNVSPVCNRYSTMDGSSQTGFNLLSLSELFRYREVLGLLHRFKWPCLSFVSISHPGNLNYFRAGNTGDLILPSKKKWDTKLLPKEYRYITIILGMHLIDRCLYIYYILYEITN
jgi:hypothetical protein